MVNSGTSEIEVPAAEGKLRLWRNTGLDSLAPGDSEMLGESTLGYEWDEDVDNGARPPGLVRLSEAIRSGVEKLQDYGSTYGSATATHSLTLYRAASDALVFGAGTVQWSWGLDGTHDRGSAPPDSRMQQATVNLFADMGAQPDTLQSGLVAASASTDDAAPTSQVTTPTAGSEVEAQQTTITGTATDAGGGEVGGVEVKIGDGAWHPAEGRGNWTYTWSPDQTGQTTIQTRAVDDSGNLESPGAGITVDVIPASCPCSIWSDSVVPPIENDPAAVELGVKFRSDVAGEITGLRFYKGPGNTGTHTGHLWTAAARSSPRPRSPARRPPAGRRSSSRRRWRSTRTPPTSPPTTPRTAATPRPTATSPGQGADSPPLHALADGVDGANGVYSYGPAGVFPTSTFEASNYWVDVVFDDDVGPDTTPPAISSVTPNAGASGVGTGTNVTATFNEAMDAATINAANFELRDASNALVPATVAYSAASRTATLDPNNALANSTDYTATIKGGPGGVKDAAGNERTSDHTWSFTTAAAPPPPPDEGPGGPILVIGSSSNPFSRYYAEILRAEGLNSFNATDLSGVTAAVLADYDVVILGEAALSAAQATDARRLGHRRRQPDRDAPGSAAVGPARPQPCRLDPVGGLPPGRYGLEPRRRDRRRDDAVPRHGRPLHRHRRDHHRPLYSDATTPTANPAVTLRSVGANGGQAAAFTYDLGAVDRLHAPGQPGLGRPVARRRRRPDPLRRPLLRRRAGRPAARLGRPRQDRDPAGRRAAAPAREPDREDERRPQAAAAVLVLPALARRPWS